MSCGATTARTFNIRCVTTAAPTLYHDCSPTGSHTGSIVYDYDGQSQYATVTILDSNWTDFYESDGTTQLAGSTKKSLTGKQTASQQWVDGTLHLHKWYILFIKQYYLGTSTRS